MAVDQDALSKMNDMNFKEIDSHNSHDNFNIEIDLNVHQADDSELVDAFDKAVKQAKEEILERRPDLKELNEDKETFSNKVSKNVKNRNLRGKHGKKNKTAWATGKNCRAVYDADGQEYEAVICYINHETGECTVKFLGYGNKESVPINSLKPSHGKGAVLEQKRLASVNVEKIPSELNESFFSPSISNERKFQAIHSSNLHTSSSFIGQDVNMPPMPPPSFLSGLPIDQSDSLSSVLMAWYMAGYHTGRYEATLNMKQNKPYNKL